MFLLASFPVGRILGIPIRIHWSAPLGLSILAAVFWLDSRGAPLRAVLEHLTLNLLIVAAIPAAVLTHELAHALAARHWGVATCGIYLHIFGGLALSTDPAMMDLKPRQKMAILAAGPFSNFIGCISALLLAGFVDSYTVSELLDVLGAVNLILGGFNLLPIWPLDGGQIFRAFLELIRLRPGWSDGITLSVSLLVALPLAYKALEARYYYNFIILVILIVAAVSLLAIFRPEPEAASRDLSQIPAAFESPDFQTVPNNLESTPDAPVILPTLPPGLRNAMDSQNIGVNACDCE